MQVLQVAYGTPVGATVDGIDYEFKFVSYQNAGGYAPVLIVDKTNEESYYSNGCITINHHIFLSQWGIEFSDYRDNFVCTREMNITIY